jgi:hypothetical protein
VVDEATLGAASTVEDLQTRQELEKQRVVALAGHSAGLADVREEIRQVAASLSPRSWDDAETKTPEESLRSMATSLLIPVDVADRISRGA